MNLHQYWYRWIRPLRVPAKLYEFVILTNDKLRQGRVGDVIFFEDIAGYLGTNELMAATSLYMLSKMGVTAWGYAILEGDQPMLYRSVREIPEKHVGKTTIACLYLKRVHPLPIEPKT